MKYLIIFIVLLILVLTIFDLIRNKPLKKYSIYGQNNRNTIVFIHGLNDDDKCWYKQIPVFSKYYKCIVVNRTADSNYLDYEDIYNIIKKNKSKGNLYCVCASYGCEAAFKIHNKYNCFDRMIFMNYTWNPAYSYDYQLKHGFIFKSSYSMWFFINIINYYLKISNILPIFLLQISFLIPSFLLARLLEYIVSGYYVYSDFFIGIKNIFTFTFTQRESQSSAYYRYMNYIKDLGMNRHKIKAIKAYIPVLTLVGEYDNIGHTNRGYIDKLCKEQNVEFELVKGQGHWFFQTKSKYINKRILNFFN